MAFMAAIVGLGLLFYILLPSRKLTWKPKKGPTKTTVPIKRGFLGFHVNLGECRVSVGQVGRWFAGLKQELQQYQA